jgi:hypothetical protein
MAATINNLFGKQGFFWWVGVVEDRKDPLKLGRCRVRIVGYHTEDKQEMPTADLPWCFPIQPILSAANSGKGDAPVGPLEGTWVFGFFADGAECQQPMMLGTMGAIPVSSAACKIQSSQNQAITGVQRDSRGNVINDANGPVTVQPEATDPGNTSSNAITSTLPPLTQAQTQSLMDAIAQKESSGSYTAVNPVTGYVGKYQFGYAILQTQGYVRAQPGRGIANSDLYNNNLWTGKNGINSVDDFFANKNNVQETAMFDSMQTNYGILRNSGVIDPATSSPDQVAGYIAASQLGAGNAIKLAQGGSFADRSGTTTQDFYNIGSTAVGGTGAVTANVLAQAPGNNKNGFVGFLKTAFGALNDPALGTPAGYTDPNSTYPTCDYTNRADTNQLATNDDALKSTPLKPKEENLVKDIETANNADGTWNEPPSAFNARYPYNQVKETEAGHVIEIDNTPNAERIHIYHKAGTYVEVDKNGTVSYHVAGDNYEVFTRNNKMYTAGNWDITVNGANTLLVKNTLDVEVLGKTTVVIHNDCDVNVAGDLRVKAKNIYMDAQEDFIINAGKNFSVNTGTDFNVKAGNYANVNSGGDMNFNVGGDEQHKVSGDFDADAALINLNSGFGLGFVLGALGASGLLDGIASNIGDAIGVDFTGLNPLATDVANPLNSIGQGVSEITGSYATGLEGLSQGGLNLLGPSNIATANYFNAGGFGDILGNALSNPAIANAVSVFGGGGLIGNISNGINLNAILTTGSVPSLLSSLGSNTFNNILQSTGIIDSIGKALDSVGLGDLDVSALVKAGGYAALNTAIQEAGKPGLEDILKLNGLTLANAVGNVSNKILSDLVSTVASTNKDIAAAFVAGDNIIENFKTRGVANIDINIAKITTAIATDAGEFQHWTDFPSSAQLSRHFNLGDVTDRVHDVKYQFSIDDNNGLSRYELSTNLKQLAVNCLDPIREQYPRMYINSGFRPTIQNLANNPVDNNVVSALYATLLELGTSSASIQAHLASQTPHNRGEAATIRVHGFKYSDYFDLAVWIKDNIFFDQLRLEYSTLGNAEPWITIICKKTGNRSAAHVDKIITTMNGKVVCNYLADLITEA